MDKFVKTIDKFRGEYGFLSNMHSCKNLIIRGNKWKTSEHAYQACKTSDYNKQLEIQNAETPVIAKHLDKTVVLRNGWNDELKIKFMEEILMAKFSDPYLKTLLLNTEDAELIEGNTWGDTFWGVCNEKGQNMLGKLLMKVRDCYKNN